MSLLAILACLLVFAVATLLGASILLALGPRAARSMVLAPVLGAALGVAFLHWQTLVMSIGAGTLLLPGAALVISVVSFALRRQSEPGWKRGVISALPAWGAGAVAAIVALIPSLMVGTNRVVMPSPSHDAFYYVQVARWLIAHRGTEVPDVGAGPDVSVDTPAAIPAYATLVLTPLRYGQELFQAWISALTGLDLVDLFTPSIATYVWFITVGAVFFLESFAIRRTFAVAGGLAAGCSFPVFTQSVVQNADSLLGIAFGLSVIAAVSRTLRARDSDRFVPVWLAALLLAAMIGTYSELLVFVGPALVVLVVFSGPREVPARLLRGAVIVALAVVMAPWAWVRAVQSLLFLQDHSSHAPGPLPLPEIATNLLGSLQNLVGGAGGLATLARIGVVVLLIVAVIGAVEAFRTAESRLVAIGLLGVGACMIGYLAFRGEVYTFHRAADLFIPLASCVVICGLAALAERASGWGSGRRSGFVRSAGMLLGPAWLFAWIAAGIASHLVAIDTSWSHRVVDSDFSEAERWVEEVARGDGSNVDVVVPDFFDQLWMVGALTGLPEVNYPVLRGDLGYLNVQSFVDAAAVEADFTLIGRGVDWGGPESAVLHQNSRFSLIRTDEATPFALVSPREPGALWSPFTAGPDAGAELLAARGASLAVDVGSGVESVLLTMRLADGSAPGSDVDPPRTATPGWSIEQLGDGGILLTRSPGASRHAVVQLDDVPPTTPGPALYVAAVEVVAE